MFIGFDSIPTPRKDEKFEPVFLAKERLRDYVITRPLNGMPAIDFYHVVFISASALKSWEITEIILNDRLDQFKRLLNADFCGSVVVNLLPKIDYTKLLGIKPDRINDSGETMEVNEGSVFSHAIKQYKKNFHWDCHLVERLGGLPLSFRERVIATDPEGFIVGFEVDYGPGRVVFLPEYEFEKPAENAAFLRKMLDTIRTRMPNGGVMEENEPKKG